MGTFGSGAIGVFGSIPAEMERSLITDLLDMSALAENSSAGHRTPLQMGGVWSFLFQRLAAGSQ